MYEPVISWAFRVKSWPDMTQTSAWVSPSAFAGGLMKTADWALVISLGILWGMSFVFVEPLLAYLSPFMIIYLRVAIGAFFLLASILNANTAFVTIVLAASLVPHETLTINRVVGALIGFVVVTTAIGYQNIF